MLEIQRKALRDHSYKAKITILQHFKIMHTLYWIPHRIQWLGLRPSKLFWMDVQSRWETWLMLWNRKMISETRCLGSLIAVRKLGGTSLCECWCMVTILWSLLQKSHLPANNTNDSHTFWIQGTPLLSHGFLLPLCSNCWQTFTFLKNDEHWVCELGDIAVPNNWLLIKAVVKKLRLSGGKSNKKRTLVKGCMNKQHTLQKMMLLSVMSVTLPVVSIEFRGFVWEPELPSLMDGEKHLWMMQNIWVVLQLGY